MTAEQVEIRVRAAAQEAYLLGKKEAQDAAPPPRMSHPQGLGGPSPRVPPSKDAKLQVRTFDGTEVYKGLGSGFKQWAKAFCAEIKMCEEACGYPWVEKYKISKFGSYMRGKAETFFTSQVDSWWSEQPTLQHVIAQMEAIFSVAITTMQCAELFKTRKAPGTTWNEHYLFLVAVKHATGASDALILENIVEHASETMRPILLGQVDASRTDYSLHASQIAKWAQVHDDKNKSVKGIGNLVNYSSKPDKPDDRKCFNCDKVGHIAKDCRKKNKGKNDGKRTPQFSLSSVGYGNVSPDDWIVDSGASVHLVRDKTMLANIEPTDEGCKLPDGSRLAVTHRGTATLTVRVNGQDQTITLANACYSPKLAINLISLGTLMEKGCSLCTVNGRHALKKGNNVIWFIHVKNRVLVVDKEDSENTTKKIDLGSVVMNAIDDSEGAPIDDAQTGTLLQFHMRFGHLAYDTVERLAAMPGSGIRLTDKKRPVCIPCAEGKVTKARQPTKDSGASSPTDVVGAVICSDLKGPITPQDRRGNRYLVNFVDHKSNYCRVFLAKTKDQAAKMFMHFLVFFEKRFNVKVHYLRTDGGGEYKNVDLFCGETGVSRQVTEANNQAANGKAERMHRTVMNMVRCMLFGCGLPLKYWGDAAEYAAYVLNRMPTRANSKRQSPIHVLTGRVADLVDIVTFGSPCTVFRDPKKDSLKRRGTAGIIVGKSEETKGYKVYIPQTQTVITTRHISNVETLNTSGNADLKRALEAENEAALDDLAKERQMRVHQSRKKKPSAVTLAEPLVEKTAE